jgi:hypothetical protein
MDYPDYICGPDFNGDCWETKILREKIMLQGQRMKFTQAELDHMKMLDRAAEQRRECADKQRQGLIPSPGSKLWDIEFKDGTKIQAYAPTATAAKELAEGGRRSMNQAGVTALDERVKSIKEVVK